MPIIDLRGCGVTADATRWLYDQGIRVMGIACFPLKIKGASGSPARTVAILTE